MTKDFSSLKGQTFDRVVRIDVGQDELQFIRSNGSKAVFTHDQDCCEAVYIAEIHGDLRDLEGTPILEAYEEVTRSKSDEDYESTTHTFYRFTTIKGTVTVRWVGTSNGYYSESVNFEEREG